MAETIEKTKLDPKLVKISLIMMLGMFAPALDATVVNVAIKTIVTELHSNISTVQWLTTAYILVMGIAVPLSGWLVNRFSGKTVYLASLVIFGLGSIGAALSWNIESLIVFRVVQGAGAGIILPTVQTVVIRYAGGAKLPSLLAMLGIPMAIIPILGPTIGGLIVNYLPWQWIFIVNIPICALALFFGIAKLPKSDAANREQKLDIIGLLLLSPAFCLLIFGISELRSAGRLELAVILLAFGLALLAVYGVYVPKSKKEPPLDIRLFKYHNFSVSVVMIFVFGMLSTGTLFILPLYFQQIHSVTAFAAGLLLAPQGIGMLLTRTQSAKFTEKNGAKIVIFAGIVCILIGTVPLIFLRSANLLPLTIILLIRGAGLGILMVPAMSMVYDGLDARSVAQGTTAVRIFQQIGGAFGTAVLAIMLSHGLASGNTSGAFDAVFLWSAVFTAVLAVPAVFLRKNKSE